MIFEKPNKVLKSRQMPFFFNKKGDFQKVNILLSNRKMSLESKRLLKAKLY